MIKINEKKNIFGDEIAFVEQYDFSKANLSEENRIKAITTVASICYQNPKAIGSESLYNRLRAESKGLPSSSFEFVPVLISESEYWDRVETKLPDDLYIDNPLIKYGEVITKDDKTYLLTNYRAVVYTKELYKDIDLTGFFNTEEECEIIKQHFKVFNYKVDLPTRSQMIRHRCSWQELSRRYVSGERVPFEFYVSEKMKEVLLFDKGVSVKGSKVKICFTAKDIIYISLKFYKQALSQGVKPQEARRFIPQACYTQIWGAFMPKQLDNYFKLRLDESAQWEIRQTATAMQELIND